MRCRGMHCTGCANGRGWGLALAVAIILTGAVITRPVEHATGDVTRMVAEVLKITAIALASAAGLAGLGGLLLLGARIRRHRAAQPRRIAIIRLPGSRPKATTAVGRLQPRPPEPQLTVSQIHLHLHVVTDEERGRTHRPARHSEPAMAKVIPSKITNGGQAVHIDRLTLDEFAHELRSPDYHMDREPYMSPEEKASLGEWLSESQAYLGSAEGQIIVRNEAKDDHEADLKAGD